MSNHLRSRTEYPPSGFILQKDVYTTNLLYANDQFPLTSLRKNLPFISITGKNNKNPSHSIQILRENGKISSNSIDKSMFYFYSKFKPKHLYKNKLKFPLPKTKTFPLYFKNLYKDINNKYIKIKNMEDDLNIPSVNGRKIIYKFKEYKKILSNFKNNPKVKRKKKEKKNENNLNNSLDKFSLNSIVDNINDELKGFKKLELERKRTFIKDRFFSTQIYFEKIMDINH